MAKLILTDVDQTVLEWGEAFEAWLIANGHPQLVAADHLYRLEDRLDCSADQIRALIEDFSITAMGDLSPIPHAREALRTLSERGWEFIAITACHDGEGVYEARLANLTRVFGNVWSKLHITGLSRGKAEILAQYEPTIWVEDSAEHAVAGAAHGHRTFLIDAPYNQGEFPGVTRVRDWREIVAAVGDQ